MHSPQLSAQDWVTRAAIANGGKYTYDLSSYIGTMHPVKICCPVHGWFSQRAAVHSLGKGCKRCGAARASAKTRFSFDDFVAKARAVHGDTYEYDSASFSGTMEKTRIMCATHGWFAQTPNKHFSGQACPLCRDKTRNLGRTLTAAVFEARAASAHNNKYKYHQDYVSYHQKISVTCPAHGLFHVAPSSHEWELTGCPRCANQRSRGEDEIAEFLRQFTDVVSRDRTIIAPRELDIVLPEYKLAVEYNGLRWHSDKFPGAKNRHLEKSVAASAAGYRLIHIFEDEWETRRSAVENLLLHAIGKSPQLGGARSFTVHKSPLKPVRAFFESNHIQGAPRGGTAYSLVDGAGVVHASMVFAKVVSERGVSGAGFELVRFASSGNISGAASRLFRAFLADTPPSRIISYSDNRLFSGTVYTTLGFTLSHQTLPDYTVVRNGIREHKSNFRKAHLKKILPNYTASKTEKQLCHENGWFRVFNCGLKKWVFQV